jgi:hypothetical protein
MPLARTLSHVSFKVEKAPLVGGQAAASPALNIRLDPAGRRLKEAISASQDCLRLLVTDCGLWSG